MEKQAFQGDNPTGPGYQSIPQPGEAPPAYPNEPPPQYEAGYDQPAQPQGYNQAPPPGYPPQQPYPTQQVFYQQPVIVASHCAVGFGCNPKPMTCQYCQQNITTTLEYETGALTWLASGLLCVFG